MVAKSKMNRASEEQLYNKEITAITTYIKAPISLNGAPPQTPQQLVAIPQAAVDALQAVDAAEVDLKQKRATATAALIAARALTDGLHAYAIASYGKSSPMLAQWGFTPETPVVKSVAVKAMAVAKGANTRVERHTMGTRQKAKIRGSAPVAPPPPPPAAGQQQAESAQREAAAAPPGGTTGNGAPGTGKE